MEIFHVVKTSTESVKQTGHASGGRSLSKIFVILLLQFMCSCASWFPMQVILICSLAGKEISPDVVNWFTVMVMPINSLSNPFVYMIRLIRRSNTRKMEKTLDEKNQTFVHSTVISQEREI